MVENNYQQLGLIQENVRILNVEEQTEIRKMDVLKFLSGPPETDLVLADPPYRFGPFDKFFDMLIRGFSNALIALETSSDLDFPEAILLNIQSSRKIGKTSLTIMKV